jgi:hypothetical protein
MALLIALRTGGSGVFICNIVSSLRCSAFLLSLTASSTASSSRALGLLTGIGGRTLLLRSFNVLRRGLYVALLGFPVALVASIITITSVALTIAVGVPVFVTAALA